MMRTRHVPLAIVLTTAGIAACASGAGGGAAAPSAPAAAAPAPQPSQPAAAPAMTMPAAPAGPLTTASGVYTAAQAARGERVFNASCLSCHVPTDYQGDAFQSKFVGGTVYDMFETIRSSMPQDNPGSLSMQQYTDLVAYLLRLNALPTRGQDLPAVTDSMKAIKVEARKPGRELIHHTGIHHHGSSHLR